MCVYVYIYTIIILMCVYIYIYIYIYTSAFGSAGAARAELAPLSCGPPGAYQIIALL